MSNYTPGKWQIMRVADDRAWVVSNNGRADVGLFEGPQAVADATLSASGPEMLEFLTELQSYFTGSINQKIGLLIAKAKGE